MTITLTLLEAARLCDWQKFCDVTGFDEYALENGGGDVETTLTEEQAREIGILPCG
jgi:hypothetical protein